MSAPFGSAQTAGQHFTYVRWSWAIPFTVKQVYGVFRGAIVVPVPWCFVGAQTAFLLNVPHDLGLIGAAAAGIVLFVTARRRS